ncbi:MAG TPA: hypothetical protein VNE38_04015 [Ktedonobacteraceae bacterium]|nr:hypothetical protein [Ktedonobacteraceae bacterium]
MKHLPLFSLFVVSLALALVIAACSSSTSGTGPYGVSTGGGQTPTATAVSGSAATIKTATMSIKGQSATVLTNAQGMTLYYRTSDTLTSVCSGSCASSWPPLVSTTTPGTASALPGSLALLSDTNGSQVTYNGHPLYTFSGDSAPGQASGEGIGGVWFVATTNLAASTPSGSTPTPAGYSNNGY